MPASFLPVGSSRRGATVRRPAEEDVNDRTPVAPLGADPWLACLASLERDLPPQQFATWIRPLRCEPTTAGVRLVAPNRFVLQWVKDRFGPRIASMLRDASGDEVGVEFGIAPQSEGRKTADAATRADIGAAPEGEDRMHAVTGQEGGIVESTRVPETAGRRGPARK